MLSSLHFTCHQCTLCRWHYIVVPFSLFSSLFRFRWKRVYTRDWSCVCVRVCLSISGERMRERACLRRRILNCCCHCKRCCFSCDVSLIRISHHTNILFELERENAQQKIERKLNGERHRRRTESKQQIFSMLFDELVTNVWMNEIKGKRNSLLPIHFWTVNSE